MNFPLVSIIIPTKNSALTLLDCLESISSQSYTNLEIIVVDNFSTDSTLKIAKKYTSQVYQKWDERTTQKNYWILQSQGEYLCFIDSDMVLEADVVSECLDIISQAESMWWVCIRERSKWNSFFARVRDFERSFYHSSDVASARFFRKKDVIEVWGFEEHIVFFEESILPQKIEKILSKNCHVSTKESSIFHLEWNLKLLPWLQKKYYYWKSMQKYILLSAQKWLSNTSKNQVGIVWRYLLFLRNKRFYSSPLLAIWVLTLKTLEFSFWGVGYFVNFITHDKK